MVAAAPALHIDGDRLRVPASAFTLSGFRDWVLSYEFPQAAQATFCSGEVLLQMSPESIETHNKVKTEITIVVGSLVRDEDLGEAYSDGVLLTNATALLSTEPDFVFATWETLRSGRLRSTPAAHRTDEYVEIVGTPDLVVEIVSQSSVKKDLDWLREGYARAGIPEYWIVDARGETVRFEILVLDGDHYRESAGAPQSSGLLGRTFTLERQKNRLGRWAYVLGASPLR